MTKTTQQQINEAVDLAFNGLCCDGGHHKQWYLDQIARILLGNQYEQTKKDAKSGEDGPLTYDWEEGIAP